MALNKDVMGKAMAAAVKAAAKGGSQEATMIAMAGAIIDHFKTAAVVSTTVKTAVKVTGTAAAQAGDGTGTGTGKVS